MTRLIAAQVLAGVLTLALAVLTLRTETEVLWLSCVIGIGFIVAFAVTLGLLLVPLGPRTTTRGGDGG